MAVQHYNIEGIDVQVTRRKNMRKIKLHVKADGAVCVSAPYYASGLEIRSIVQRNVDWIAQMRQKMAGSTRAKAETATDAEKAEWRAVVQACVPVLLEKWEPIIGVRVKKLAYRNMKSRWGSCQPSTGRVCINTRLALYPPRCLEYVVVHELCHFLEPSHNQRFKALMTHYLPDWRESEKLLRS